MRKNQFQNSDEPIFSKISVNFGPSGFQDGINSMMLIRNFQKSKKNIEWHIGWWKHVNSFEEVRVWKSWWVQKRNISGIFELSRFQCKNKKVRYSNKHLPKCDYFPISTFVEELKRVFLGDSWLGISISVIIKSVRAFRDYQKSSGRNKISFLNFWSRRRWKFWSKKSNQCLRPTKLQFRKNVNPNSNSSAFSNYQNPTQTTINFFQK